MECVCVRTSVCVRGALTAEPSGTAAAGNDSPTTTASDGVTAAVSMVVLVIQSGMRYEYN